MWSWMIGLIIISTSASSTLDISLRRIRWKDTIILLKCMDSLELTDRRLLFMNEHSKILSWYTRLNQGWEVLIAFYLTSCRMALYHSSFNIQNCFWHFELRFFRKLALILIFIKFIGVIFCPIVAVIWSIFEEVCSLCRKITLAFIDMNSILNLIVLYNNIVILMVCFIIVLICVIFKFS